MYLSRTPPPHALPFMQGMLPDEAADLEAVDALLYLNYSPAAAPIASPAATAVRHPKAKKKGSSTSAAPRSKPPAKAAAAAAAASGGGSCRRGRPAAAAAAAAAAAGTGSDSEEPEPQAPAPKRRRAAAEAEDRVRHIAEYERSPTPPAVTHQHINAAPSAAAAELAPPGTAPAATTVDKLLFLLVKCDKAAMNADLDLLQQKLEEIVDEARASRGQQQGSRRMVGDQPLQHLRHLAESGSE